MGSDMTIIHNARHIVIPAMAGLHVAVPRRTSAAGGWWVVAGKTCVAAYAPKGAASQAASYVNLANPGTYDAAPGTAPTFDTATGWTFNGSSQYLTTGVSPSGDQTWSMFIRLSNMTNQFATLAGLVSTSLGNNWFSVFAYNGIPYYSSGGWYQSSTAGSDVRNTALVLGVAGRVGYKNGDADCTMDAVSKGASGLDITIGSRNVDGSQDEYFAGNILALAIYSATLTDIQSASLSTAMAAL
jgi:hypothetical protein